MTAPAQDDDFGIDFSPSEDNWESRSVDMADYSKSPESEEASWWDVAKDVIVQPALGAAQAFTWPADVLKIGMVGEGLSGLDELEDEFKKAGKPFDRDKYIKDVAETSQFIPTQQLLEDVVSAKTGISLEPKSETGKWIRKLFFLKQLAKGAGTGKSIAAGVTGSSTTSALKAAGVNETAAELTGDVVGGGVAAIEKIPRIFSPEVQALEKTAVKHGLPFPEYLTREQAELVSPKISESRKAALQKDLGMDSQQAIDKVIEGTLNAAQMRKAGHNLEVLYTDAYDTARSMAAKNPKPISGKSIVSDIDAEIARIRSNAPSPSDAEQAAINVLDKEKKVYESPKFKMNTDQAINQIQNYNSNVKNIYKKAEFSGVENEVRGAYAFLNNSVRNSIENEVDPTIRHVLSAGDKIFSEAARLDRAEGLVSKAFKNGEYNPKKLSDLMTSRQGQIVRRELGDQAVNEIREIAKYGEAAVKATNQLAKSSKHLFNIGEWGPIAGFVLAKMPKAAGIALALKPAADNVRGYLLTNPATRTVYKSIVKNAANGSFKNMAKDFAHLESEISKEFGSVEEFMDSIVSDLEFYNDEVD